jgi:hypothetical protein
MEQVSRVWFTAQQKAELWKRWKSGQCIAAIARTLGKTEQQRGLSGSGAEWRHCADTAPEGCGSAKAGGARGNIAWFCGGPVAPTDCLWA